MGIGTAFSDALDALQRNPVLFVAAFVVTFVGLTILGVELLVLPGTATGYWWAASLLVQLVALFFVGGAYGMATEGLHGSTRLDTLLSAGKDNYGSLLGATLLLVLASFVAGILVAVVAIAGSFAVAGGLGVSGLTLITLVSLGSYVVAFLPYFFLQFYAPAVVASGDGAVESLKRSFGLVRRNLLRTLGFDVVLAFVVLVGAAPTLWLYAQWWNSWFSFESVETTAPETFSPFAGLDPTTVAAYFVATLVLATLSGALFYALQVAFYEELLGDADETASETAQRA